MDKKELWKIEDELHSEVRKLEAEQAKYAEGLKEGIRLTVNAVRDALNREMEAENHE